MATLKRQHTPVPWGAHVEMIVWVRSERGTPRRRRSDKPSLNHDSGWDWDGKQLLFNEETNAVASDREVFDRDVYDWEDEHSLVSAEKAYATLSLLDIARYQVPKRHGKARSVIDDFEVIRVPRVVPISEEEVDLGERWMLREWENLETFGFKRTYSEVAQGSLYGKDPPNNPGCSQPASGGANDDLWEYL